MLNLLNKKYFLWDIAKTRRTFCPNVYSTDGMQFTRKAFANCLPSFCKKSAINPLIWSKAHAAFQHKIAK